MKEQPILIQVAMEIECQEILKKIDNIQEIEIQTYKFYKGTLNNSEIVVSLSKVGLIQTSASLTIAINEFQPRMIINLGIAGACDKELHVGDIVIGESCMNINSYRTANLKENEGSNPETWELLTFLSGEEDRLIEQKANITLIELTKNFTKNEYGKIYYGKIGSGDVWNREIDRILFLNKKYKILCEDMESIATYTLANQWNIPVLSIKMISDNSLTGETYDRTVGIWLEKYITNFLEKIIQEQ